MADVYRSGVLVLLHLYTSVVRVTFRRQTNNEATSPRSLNHAFSLHVIDANKLMEAGWNHQCREYPLAEY